MSLAFIPLYIKFLGIEAYGIIGFFTTLQAMFTLLDLGLGYTLNRELARYSILPEQGQKMRNLVRTLEIIYWGIAIFIGMTVVFISPFIAKYWIKSENLSIATMQQALILMGIAIAFQWPLKFYSGGLDGLQKQTLHNLIQSSVATLRGIGAVVILWLISPTIDAFFAWQIIVSLFNTILIALALWYNLPTGKQIARFDKQLLRSVWHFATGMTAISATALFLTQLDKILLSVLLPLKTFGYYMLANAAAAVLFHFISPIVTAIFPKFFQLVALNTEQELTMLYHRICQFMSIVILPAAVVLAMFSYQVMLIWTGDPIIAENTCWLVSFLVIGNALNGLINLPCGIQLAYGWTNLIFYINLVSILVLIPMLIVMVYYYGAIGAAIIWILLNVGHIIFNVQIMHRYLLKGEQWRWYREDVGIPLIVALIITSLGRWLLPLNISPLTTMIYIAGVSLIVLIVTAVATPHIRASIYVNMDYYVHTVFAKYQIGLITIKKIRPQ